MNEINIKTSLKVFLCEELKVEEAVLDYDSPLFGDGPIGLDSIDSLEIIAFVDNEYGVNMTGVEKEYFYSIDTITAYIMSCGQD